ncbi:UDP-galactopyranose mutase [Fundidesulfovibrio magnetotacticus]|uniref:UDP-galactopyranose mutase n=1 Tax=Fundidesulfovibrio magnetotacticus TaxID=2730080 RepID=A0A6V8LZ64_9BACT|nr:UDP-galactopyranose mutase [Fundidesulfovibrio magnetotacticus]GFK94937.1 UDP-galactopyranose mutase [Fundidesulfovibrio magnetotacticus]
MKKAIVVGGGFAGCVVTQMLQSKGFQVTVVEAGSTIGGGCRTFFYHGHPYTIGPRHILVDVDEMYTWEYVERFVEMRELRHHSLTYVSQDDRFYTYPIHKDEIASMPDKEAIENELANRGDVSASKNFEEYWVNSVGHTLYDKFVNTYSKKMWGLRNNQEIDDFGFSPKGVALKDGDRVSFEGSKVIGYPVNLEGFNPFFEACVQDATVIRDTPVHRFDLDNKRVLAGDQWLSADLIVSTISPDIVFDYCHGELRYIGRHFMKLILPCERVTPEPYYFLYYAGDEPYTRVVEYKLLTGYTAPDTLLGIEIPTFDNKLYPYPVKADIAKAQRYIAMFPQDVHTIGRMGKYHYDNMHVVIRDCFKLMESI